MTQINEYADDLVISAIIKKAMESLKPPNENASELGLSINQENTKYIEINAQEATEIRIKM